MFPLPISSKTVPSNASFSNYQLDRAI